MQPKRKLKVVRIPVARTKAARQPAQQQATKRLTLTIPTTLYEQLEALVILERAVKATQGQKQVRKRRELLKRRLYGGLDE